MFTVQIGPKYRCCMFVPQSNEKDRKNRAICQKTSCDSVNVDVTIPTSLGNFPIIGKFPNRENSVLLTVVHCNQRQKCCKNSNTKYHGHFKKHVIQSNLYVSTNPWNTNGK